jgi:HPt (histidine-containing phosphotransfer) domain-containing protein
MHESPRREPILSEFAADPGMQDLLTLFVSELPERLTAIRDAWDQSDLESIRRIAHQLKGASGGYGFGAIGTAAARLEASLAAQETDLTLAQNELTALIDLCQRAKA